MNDIVHSPVGRPARKLRPNLPTGARGPSVVMAALLAVLLTGCGHVSVPKVSMPNLPGLGDDEPEAAAVAVDLTATPRDLLGAHLVNPRTSEDTPNMTVGKMIEYADRYLACDCAGTRFVRSWEKTAEGYRATVNSGAVRPLEFTCRDVEAGRECYLIEIDRGPQSPSFPERFVPGSNFIQFLYQHGVQCERAEPCPAATAK